MKISLAAFAALLITGSMFLQPALAQSAPQGSYRASCTDARVEDRTLTAVCRIADGREQGHPSRMSIGASAISGTTMACLHAITGSRWRPTVRIAGKNILGFGKIGAALSAPGQRAFVVEPRDRP
jgi:hypothetical protein